MINPDWFWCKHTTSKPVNKNSELRNIENSIISRINDLIIQEEKITKNDFLEKIKMLNLEAWNKSYEMIN